MRLINVQDEHLMFFEQFNEPEIPKYAILSHTWEEEEVSYLDACASFSIHGAHPVSLKAGYQKLKRFAAVAQGLGLNYIWIDTCCIDKSSSAELSEAINSMYRWYRNSARCCIYLADIPEQPKNYLSWAERQKFSQIVKKTRWLTRGWTLQEFLAPRNRTFYSMNWTAITLEFLVTRSISEETGIPSKAYHDFKPEQWSVAQKMSWAAKRQTTRVEDRAYSLLGIFNVNMPLIYGEGESAFRRFQEEILKYSTDQTIFCWRSPGANYATWRGLLARSPKEFAASGNILENKGVNAFPFQLTNKGIQLSLEHVAEKDVIAFLQCYNAETLERCGIYLQRTHDDNYVRIQPDKLVEEILPRLGCSKTKAPKTLFAKPELAGIIWRKLDMCPRIAGFRFPSFIDHPHLIVSIAGTTHDFEGRDRVDLPSLIVSFDFGGSESEIARCCIDRYPKCTTEILVKYDRRKKYGEGGERDQGNNTNDDSAKSDWLQSNCCEWKVEGSNCNKFEISASSWVEIDDKSGACIHVEFSDNADHGDCG